MDIEAIRKYCLSLPHATEDVQWGHDLLFRIREKMFAVIDMNPDQPGGVSFKCDPETFAELIETEGIRPAPYVARYHWVNVQDLGALDSSTFRKLIKHSYNLVLAKIPAKKRKLLQSKV